MSTDQRRHLRVGAGFPVSLAMATGPSLEGVGTNISRGGLEVVVDAGREAVAARLEDGKGEVRAEASLPFMTRSPAHVSVGVEVVRVDESPRGTHLGLRFRQVSDPVAESIEAYVLERMRFDEG